MSNNLPYAMDPDVITFSPFSGECDICPNGETETHFLTYICGQVVQASLENVYRGFGAILFYSWKEMDEVCAQGFHDAYSFIKREGKKYFFQNVILFFLLHHLMVSKLSVSIG